MKLKNLFLDVILATGILKVTIIKSINRQNINCLLLILINAEKIYSFTVNITILYSLLWMKLNHLITIKNIIVVGFTLNLNNIFLYMATGGIVTHLLNIA